MSTKLEVPILSGTLNTFTVNGWLNLCQDLFEVHAAVNASPLKASIQIVLAEIKMEAPTARGWWNENREDLKSLTTWDDFATRVKDQFVPANWKMDALAQFYTISLSSSLFVDYTSRLQEAHNVLSTGDTGFTISDSVFKNHLLFFAHSILSLRMRSIPSFDYPKTRVDGLIVLMSATWDSMVAEQVARAPLAATSFPPLSTTSAIASKAPKTFVPLTDHEHDALKQAGGCFCCRQTPSSPGWVQHGSQNCPGDEANGVAPSPICHVATVVNEDDDGSDESDFVTAVFPLCVLGDGSFLEGEEEDDE